MESYEEPPCRIVLQTKTRCPKCQKSVTIKTLKYTHVCGRTVEERVHEEERKAHAKHTKYSSLLAQINQSTRGPPGKPYVEISFGKVGVPHVP